MTFDLNEADSVRGSREPGAAVRLGGGVRRPAVRRRPTPEQGRSLEMLGHAIEYLIDMELRYGKEVPSKDVGDATRILMALNREVFSECAEVVSLGARLRGALTNMFGRPAMQFPARTGRHL